MKLKKDSLPIAAERDAIPTTPALDDESLDDEQLEAVVGEGAAVGAFAFVPEHNPVPEPEPALTLPTRSAVKAKGLHEKAKYVVWVHGALQLNGVTYTPGEFVSLTTAQAESIGECVKLAEF